jgi:hypothetical protein
MVIVTTIYEENLNISKNNNYVAYVEKILGSGTEVVVLHQMYL